MRVSVVGAVVIDGPTQRSAPTGAIVICCRGGPLCPPATAYVPPGSPSSVMAAPCHLLPCGAKAIAVLMLRAHRPFGAPLIRPSVPTGAPSPRRRLLLAIPENLSAAPGGKNPGAADVCLRRAGAGVQGKKISPSAAETGRGSGEFSTNVEKWAKIKHMALTAVCGHGTIKCSYGLTGQKFLF